MSQESLCSFCETLPGTARPGWGGSSSKCPVCRQPLWVAQNGATYRLDVSAAPAASGKWLWAAGLGAAAGLCVLLSLVPFALRSGPKQLAQANVKPTPHTSKSASLAAPEPGPSVQAKFASQPEAARVKPSSPPSVAREPVAPAPKVVAQAPPAKVETAMPPAKEMLKVTPPSPRPVFVSLNERDLEAQLRGVPEVDLDPDYLKKSKDQIAAFAKDIIAANKDEKDAFIAKVMKQRQDLAGMPFLMGKDCSISSKEAAELASRSRLIRMHISEFERTSKSRSKNYPSASDYISPSAPVSDPAAQHFWNAINGSSIRDRWQKTPEGVATLQQMLPVENRDFRLGLVAHLKDIKDVKATEAIANRAVFDLDSQVRLAAIATLRERPKEQYRGSLIKALRYPWQPVVEHAAEAIYALELKELVPDLVAMLDEPDPRAPFVVKGEDGKDKLMVRELVRINHHRNCMLCHAPINLAAMDPVEQRALRSLPVGPSPSPQEPLPPSASTVYYAPKSGNTLVRADITYLRQDFSLRQPVMDAGKWPEMQRFDFLVRTREATTKEAAQRPASFVEYKEAVIDALIALTGKHAPPTAQAWRNVLASPEPRVEAKVKPNANAK